MNTSRQRTVPRPMAAATGPMRCATAASAAPRPRSSQLFAQRLAEAVDEAPALVAQAESVGREAPRPVELARARRHHDRRLDAVIVHARRRRDEPHAQAEAPALVEDM